MMEEYRAILEDTARLGERRQRTNDVYLAINTALLSGIGLLVVSTRFTSWWTVTLLGFISLLTIPLNLTWRQLLGTYRRLLGARYEILVKLEHRAEFTGKLYTTLAEKSRGVAAGRMTTTVSEVRLALFILGLYPVLTAAAVAVTYLVAHGVIAPLP